jgi:hypothetical protein
MMSKDDVPGPGTYIGVKGKTEGPRFTMRGRVDDIDSPNRRLRRSQSEGAPAAGQRNIRR